jgi:hypothetical protein
MKIAKTAGVAITSLGMVIGLSGLAGATSGTIGLTGPHSNNQITSTLNRNAVLTNTNTLGIDNWNDQDAHSGNASVDCNTTGGSAVTGAASNFNSTNTNLSVVNGAGGAGLGAWFAPSSNFASINTTGPKSNNQVTFTENANLVVTNTNTVSVTNHNDQDARSGNARVSGNTLGGSAITGNASNSNQTSTSVNIAN